jgi:predicted deacetylase
MNWSVWDKVEALLIDRQIRPIIAVVPDNRDAKLNAAPHCDDFWDRVRQWQGRGWSIGWHGFQHIYETSAAGIVGINKRSEFAGVSRSEQLRKLRAAYEIFSRHGIRPDLWVAPGHSFDRQTVELLQTFGVDVISDGFYLRPVLALGSLWIPQQLWTLRHMPWGLWTVCYHVNRWADKDLVRFERAIDEFRGRFVSIADVVKSPRSPKTAVDAAVERCYRAAVLLKRALSS